MRTTLGSLSSSVMGASDGPDSLEFQRRYLVHLFRRVSLYLMKAMSLLHLRHMEPVVQSACLLEVLGLSFIPVFRSIHAM
jgi:hypothetical protein